MIEVFVCVASVLWRGGGGFLQVVMKDLNSIRRRLDGSPTALGASQSSPHCLAQAHQCHQAVSSLLPGPEVQAVPCAGRTSSAVALASAKFRHQQESNRGNARVCNSVPLGLTVAALRVSCARAQVYHSLHLTWSSRRASSESTNFTKASQRGAGF